MKNILFMLTLLVTNVMSCQISSNIISETDFYNIKINNIPLHDIVTTNGDRQQLRDLIPAFIIESNIDPDGEFSYYSYDGFKIGFSRNLGTIDNPILGGFEITKNNWNLTIQGTTITIGDDISALGNVVFNTMRSGDKSIIYQYCHGCNNFIYIYFDQNTNLITEIGFIEQT